MYAPKEGVVMDLLLIGGAFVLVCLFITYERVRGRI